MNEKEQNLYDSLMNLSTIAAQNLKELATWKELAIGRGEDIKRLRKELDEYKKLSFDRAKEINSLHERHKEEEDRSYKRVLYLFNEYHKFLSLTLNETNADKKANYCRNADSYLKTYIGAQQIYEAVFGLFRFRPDDYINIFGKDENKHED